MAVPLDKKVVDGIPALDPHWKADVSFLRYSSPPLSAADAASVEEWGEQLGFIEEDLHWLLTLPHDKFWCEVIFEPTVLQCVDSYLRYAPRCYDVVHTLPPQLSEQHDRVHRQIFMVCVRMATHKESKESFITPSVFGEILYENFLFDVPKLMDLCVLYGDGNGPLLAKMIGNIFTNQPSYHDDLQAVVPTVLQVFTSIHKKCVDDNPSGSPQKLSATKRKNVIEEISDGDFQDIIFYLLDTSFTLRHFLEVYPAATLEFSQCNFPVRLAQFYESIVGSLSEALKCRDWQTPGLEDLLRNKLHVAQINLLKSFRSIVFTTCLQPLLEDSCYGNAERLIEQYFDIFSNVIAEKRFLGHLESLFPFHDDEELLTQTQYEIDETRLQFLQDGIKEAHTMYGKSTKRKPTKKEQFSGLCPQEVHPGEASGGDVNQDEGAAGACAPGVSDVELQSLTAAVKDLLPDLGDGFVEICLDEFGYDAERVINALLEDRLPPSLQDLDRTMTRSKFSPGGYIDPEVAAEEESLLCQRKNVFDNDEFDVFNRKDVDASRIHVGKVDKLGGLNMKDFLNDKSAILESRSRYDPYSVGIIEEDIENDGQGEYDDEYDDTYDTNEIGADDADSADELTTRRPFTTPRILGGRNPSRDIKRESSSEDSEEDGPRRDNFVEDPAVVRERLAQRHAHKQQRQGHKPQGQKVFDVKGNQKGQGQSSEVLRNRANKEKHKSSRVNHNRKAMSDRKRRVP